MDLDALEKSHGQWLIDEFVEVANQLLPLYLPEIKGNSKVKELINSRIVKNYATQKLIDEPIYQHRYAFYSYRHLLQLLLVKRLLTEGIGAAAINNLLTTKTNEELKSLLVGGIQINLTTVYPDLTETTDFNNNAALDFLVDLKGKRNQSRNSVNQTRTTKPRFQLDEHNDPNKGEKWTRLKILDGLELHIRDDFIYPNSIKERDSLYQYLSNILSQWFKRRQS
jgi:hypothetical protein